MRIIVCLFVRFGAINLIHNLFKFYNLLTATSLPYLSLSSCFLLVSPLCFVCALFTHLILSFFFFFIFFCNVISIPKRFRAACVNSQRVCSVGRVIDWRTWASKFVKRVGAVWMIVCLLIF